MPEICHFYGIIITMYLPDHNPPHFQCAITSIALPSTYRRVK